MSLAAHKRWTVAFDTPAMRAIVRQLHRPSVAGGVTALSRTTRTASSGTEGLRPRPVASSNPARRLARNRWYQRLTVTRDTPTRAAIWCCEIHRRAEHHNLRPLPVADGHRRRVDPAFQLAALLATQYNLAAPPLPPTISPQHVQRHHALVKLFERHYTSGTALYRGSGRLLKPRPGRWRGRA